MIQADDAPMLGLYSRDVAALRRVALFAEFGNEELQALASVAHRHLHRRGEMIPPPTGEGYLYVVVRGQIRRYLLSADGRELTLGWSQVGDVFELWHPADECDGDAVAEVLDDGTTVYVLPWSALLEVLARHPRAAISLARLLRAGLIEERRLIAAIAFRKVKSRLACRLIDLAGGCASRPIRETREMLAAAIGSRSDEVTKTLREFKEMGLVEYRPHGRVITVVDPDGLRTYGSA